MKKVSKGGPAENKVILQHEMSGLAIETAYLLACAWNGSVGIA